MRILHCTDLYYPQPGGLERVAQVLAESFARQGHQVDVLTSHFIPGLPDEETHEGVRIHRRPMLAALMANDPASIAACIHSARALQADIRPDLVHLHVPSPTAFFQFRTPKVPWVLTLHGSVTRAGGTADGLLGRLLREANGIAAVSQAMLDIAAALVPEARDRMSVIHNALPLPDVADGRQDPNRLFAFGRLIPEKGMDVLLRAFAILHGKRPRLRLVLAGDGAARTDLEALAAAFDLGGAVEFTGWLPEEEIRQHIRCAAFVVLPSRFPEAFSLAALESALQERAVVAARVGGLPEVVLQGETGLLFRQEDLEGLLMAITSLLDNPALAERLGKKARLNAIRRFCLDRHLDAYAALYGRAV